jgi:hypothetical protein
MTAAASEFLRCRRRSLEFADHRCARRRIFSMDVRGYIDRHAPEFPGALKGAEAVAYRWDELAATAGELVAAR